MAIEEIKDAIGNTLHQNDLCAVDMSTKKIQVAEIVGIKNGGVSLLGGRETPTIVTLQITIDVPVRAGQRIAGLYALRHPTRKELEVPPGNAA